MSMTTAPSHSPLAGVPVTPRHAPGLRALLRGVGALALLASVATSARVSQAQPIATPDSTAASAARLELQRQADSLAAHGNPAQASVVRQRLAEGDFRPGDRIMLAITGNMTFRDTIAVREGQVVRVGTLPDIPIRGVLRAELTDYMTRQLSRFVRDPVVHAEALTRVAVLGAVGRPGYYALPADILLGDAIMAAGGPAGNADVSKTIVRRGKTEVLSKSQVQSAIRDGKTLDRIDLRAGDEIVVAEKKQRNVMNLIYAATGILSLGLTLYSLANR